MKQIQGRELTYNKSKYLGHTKEKLHIELPHTKVW
jgi:hypothetical protein